MHTADMSKNTKSRDRFGYDMITTSLLHSVFEEETVLQSQCEWELSVYRSRKSVSTLSMLDGN